MTEPAERWADALNELTLRSDLQLLTLLPLRNLVSQFKLISSDSQFCPACYAEDEEEGRQKYNRLIWSFDCVTGCSSHGFRLIREAQVNAANQLPFTVPGISRIDGTSLANRATEEASAYEVGIARIVAELLDDVVCFRDPSQQTTGLPAFLRHAANVLFAGKPAHLARHLGVNKSDVHGWMRTNVLPSLPRVALIAYCCDCAIADVLLGNKVMLRARNRPSDTTTALLKRRRTGSRKPLKVLLTELQELMRQDVTLCAQDAADRLDISAKYLRKIAPKLNATLVEQGDLHRRGQAQNRRDMQDRQYLLSHLEIAATGRYPARRVVVKHAEEASGTKFRFGETTRAQRKAHEVSRIGMRRPAHWRGLNARTAGQEARIGSITDESSRQ